MNSTRHDMELRLCLLLFDLDLIRVRGGGTQFEGFFICMYKYAGVCMRASTNSNSSSSSASSAGGNSTGGSGSSDGAKRGLGYLLSFQAYRYRVS